MRQPFLRILRWFPTLSRSSRMSSLRKLTLLAALACSVASPAFVVAAAEDAAFSADFPGGGGTG
ncbi:hypothetical protein QT352_16395 [Escherichia coli]|nr:hypothetical protein [Escherichia coli]